MKSLLNKSLTRFMVCTAIILLVCTPLFYLLTRHFYAEDMVDLIESVRRGGDIPANDLETDIMAGVMIQFALIIGVLSIASVVTMRWVSKRLWIPFEDTLHKTEQFDVDKDSSIPQFVDTDTSEFYKLNASLEKLMRRCVARYRQQKEFTENASHELQTPIAIVQSKLDVLLQANLDEHQTQIVQELYEVGSRMARLNRNLLLLAKIDNRQFETYQSIDVEPLLRKNIEQLHELYGVRCVIQNGGEKYCIEGNASLVEIMINNLLVNAFRHTAHEEIIEVRCRNGEFRVCNSAADGVALDSERIFSRFNHASDANRGTGIGLAIVKAVCDYHGWEIVYSFENSKHIFTVRF